MSIEELNDTISAARGIKPTITLPEDVEPDPQPSLLRFVVVWMAALIALFVLSYLVFPPQP